jgi:hypothetical protein
MKLNPNNILKGFISLAFINDNQILVSKGNHLYVFNFSDNSYNYVLSLPCPFIIKLFLKVKLLTRLLRLGVRTAANIAENKFVVVFDKKFYEVDLENSTYIESFHIPRGNRPLNIVDVRNIKGFDNSSYFGEYFENFSRDLVNVYKRLPDSTWEVVYTFPKGVIEHVHTIVPDEYRECLWIFTGDFDNASAIWKVEDNFKRVEAVLIGNQNYRACVGFAVPEGIVYATDTQFERNSVRILREGSYDLWVSDFICEINGPSIYGCKVKNDLFFSTSVEGDGTHLSYFMKLINRKPGLGIIESSSQIVGGNLINGFSVIHKNNKDFWPFVLFQFGAITFPSGVNNTERLVIFNIALSENDLATEIFEILN